MNAITQVRSGAARESAEARGLDFKLEVVVIPVSDVARAAEFYTMLGWRRDADVVIGSRRPLQFTPPGLAMLDHLRDERYSDYVRPGKVSPPCRLRHRDGVPGADQQGCQSE